MIHRTLRLAAWLLLLGASTSFADERPNILFIFADDFGWRDAGFMGSDFYETPHLDRLASEGIVFTHAYSAAANCAPARASLLSGQYTPRHQVYNVGVSPRGDARFRRLIHVPGVDVLDLKIETWAERLQAAGYATGIFGKWHLSRDPRPYGFDVNVGGSHSGSPPNGYYPPHPGVPGLQDAPEGEYLTDRLADEAIAFIRRNKDRPWCAYLSHFAVHTPLVSKRELVSKYQEKPPGDLHGNVAMATMIQSLDDGIGRLRATLDELGLADDTVIVFFSDNGGYGPATDMAPLRGSKGMYYEGGIREPLVVAWPGVVAPGVVDEPVIGVDLYPTLCEIADAGLPTDQPLDGVSLLPLLQGKSLPHAERPLFWHFPAYLEPYARSGEAEARDPLFRSRPVSVVRRGDWKLHRFHEDGGLELYDLKNDPAESKNLAAELPEKTQDLLRLLERWQKDVEAPIPVEQNPQFDSAAEAAALAEAAKRRSAKRQGAAR